MRQRVRAARLAPVGSLRLYVESLEDRRLLAVVTGRHLFYNDSGTAAPLRYDGSDPAINASDDLAIATDKQAYRPGLSFTVDRITNNAKQDNEVRVFGSHVVWQGTGGSDGGTDLEIFWYDGTTIVQLTENTVPDRFPEVSASGILWERGSGTSQEVIFHDFTSEIPLTSNSVFDGNATLVGHRVVWEQGASNAIEIMSWDGVTTTNLSQNAVVDRNPQGQGAQTVWVKGSTPNQQVMLHDGTNPAVPVDSSTLAMEDARVSGQYVAWEGFAGTTANDREIYQYDGTSVNRISNNAFPDFDPQVQEQFIVWWGGTFNNFHIYLYDGSTIRQLSSGIRNQFPKIDGQFVVWQGYDGNDNEIFAWDGTQVYQLTDNTADDTNPQISGGHIVWQSQTGADGTTLEIYEAIVGPEVSSSFANVSSYSKGINGIMVDIAGLPGTMSASDFSFRTGNNNMPSTWATVPDTATISIRSGAGVAGSDRVTIVWPSGTIVKTWLQVIVKGNDFSGGYHTNTGLAQSDIFYFASAVGDSGLGNSATQATVNTTDELAARNNPESVFNNIPITNLFDYNRDGAVNTSDQLIARNNPTNAGNVVRFITLGNPPAAPEAAASRAVEAESTGGVASALALPGLDSRIVVPASSGPRRIERQNVADGKDGGQAVAPAARSLLARAMLELAGENALETSRDAELGIDELLAELTTGD